jgi:polar amino acid transport system permease protein
MIQELLSHSGFLAHGFAVNLLISVVSMTAGTILGVALGLWRAARRVGGSLVGGFATSICRNVPSFVLLFYMASMIPSEVELSGQIIAVPLWIKATLALTFPVIGFASDQTLGYVRQTRDGTSGAFETFAVAWLQYFLIIIMASATASVIGADEIVGRANTLIAQSGDDGLLLPIYVFVSLWFILTGLVFSGVLKIILWAKT